MWINKKVEIFFKVEVQMQTSSLKCHAFQLIVGLASFLVLGVASTVVHAALPTKAQVPETAALPIDGEWESTIWGQRLTFRLEKGRWYATTPYTVALLWPVHVGDVVVKNVRSPAAGKYVGYDIGLSGTWTAKLLPNGNLKIYTNGTLIKLNAIDKPLSLDNRAWYNKEIAAIRAGNDTRPTTPPIAAVAPPQGGQAGAPALPPAPATGAPALPAQPPTATASPGKIDLDTAADAEYPGKVKVCLSNMSQSGSWEGLGINSKPGSWTIEADGVGAWTCTDAEPEPTTIRFFRADGHGNKTDVLTKDYDLTHYANQRITFTWSD